MAYENTAKECLEDGCSLETVESLLADLMAVEEPSKDVVQTIKKLKKAWTHI